MKNGSTTLPSHTINKKIMYFVLKSQKVHYLKPKAFIMLARTHARTHTHTLLFKYPLFACQAAHILRCY